MSPITNIFCIVFVVVVVVVVVVVIVIVVFFLQVLHLCWYNRCVKIYCYFFFLLSSSLLSPVNC